MSEVPFVHPKNQQPLVQSGNHFADKDGNQFPFVNGVFRFVDSSGYSASFGYQWKKFKRTQLDKFSGQSISYDRFFLSSTLLKNLYKIALESPINIEKGF